MTGAILSNILMFILAAVIAGFGLFIYRSDKADEAKRNSKT